MTESSRLILDAFQAALQSVDPEAATASAVSDLEVASWNRPIDIVAIGKAAIPMARGAVSALPGQRHRVFAITKDDHDLGPVDPDWRFRFAAHPVLDQRSLTATSDLLKWLAEGDPGTATLCLISGGGSALLELPVEGVSLADFQTLTRSLLTAGADIQQLNTVRSRISQVKGGRLRQHIRSRTCISLLLSDVLGNDLSVIASGPTVRSDRTADDAIAILDRFHLAVSVPPHVLTAISASNDDRLDYGSGDVVQIVADNNLAVEAAARSLTNSGHQTLIGWRDRTGEAREAAAEWVELIASLPDDVSAVVGGGELTVTVRGDGTGGRNTEFALAVAIAMQQSGRTGWTIASLATDGQDNTTGVAGAIVDGTAMQRMIDLGIDPIIELACNNSAQPLQRIEATITPGPTGTNVNDLYFAVRTQPG